MDDLWTNEMSTKTKETVYGHTCLTKNGPTHSAYKDYIYNLNRILRKTRESYYQTKCTDFKRNTKRLWQMINRITNKSTNKATLIEYLKVDNIEVHNANEIANQFAKYFSTIGKKYANKIDPSTTSIHTYIKNIGNNPSKHHSCENAICELVCKILKDQEQKKTTVGIFLDLSKAFDTLSHNILLQKLNKSGIREKASDWFDSCLTNIQLRTKCTTQNDGSNQYSEYVSIEYGTPQGSCLGLLLFLIFTNDLYLCIENGSCILVCITATST